LKSQKKYKGRVGAGAAFFCGAGADISAVCRHRGSKVCETEQPRIARISLKNRFEFLS
jgi:hypothetical protein